VAILLAFVCTSLAVTEIPMKHKKRSEREAKIFIDYMNRGPIVERVNKLLTKIFPSNLTPNIYAYPEVKILNYLDAQYYGYRIKYVDKSILELLLKASELCSILDHLTFGFLPRSAEFHQLAIFTNTTIAPRVQPMSTMAVISTLHMGQEQSLDLLDRIPLGLLGYRLRILFLDKLLD